MTRAFPKFGYNLVTGEWNDSLKGDCFWSSVNISEAVPDVMTPSMLLKTGEHVRVGGGSGIVEILSRSFAQKGRSC